MAIQMRRGLLARYDESKMLAGELAVTTNPETENQQVFVAFAPGNSKRILTEDDAETINSALENKAPKSSPTFSGTPKAPTAAAGTNNTQIANTAFVKAAIDAASKTLNATDKGSGVVELSLV